MASRPSGRPMARPGARPAGPFAPAKLRVCTAPALEAARVIAPPRNASGAPARKTPSSLADSAPGLDSVTTPVIRAPSGPAPDRLTAAPKAAPSGPRRCKDSAPPASWATRPNVISAPPAWISTSRAALGEISARMPVAAVSALTAAASAPRPPADRSAAMARVSGCRQSASDLPGPRGGPAAPPLSARWPRPARPRRSGRRDARRWCLQPGSGCPRRPVHPATERLQAGAVRDPPR